MQGRPIWMIYDRGGAYRVDLTTRTASVLKKRRTTRNTIEYFSAIKGARQVNRLLKLAEEKEAKWQSTLSPNEEKTKAKYKATGWCDHGYPWETPCFHCGRE